MRQAFHQALRAYRSTALRARPHPTRESVHSVDPSLRPNAGLAQHLREFGEAAKRHDAPRCARAAASYATLLEAVDEHEFQLIEGGWGGTRDAATHLEHLRSVSRHVGLSMPILHEDAPVDASKKSH